MYVLGLYSDGDYFKVSLLSRKGKRIRIEYLKEFKKNVSNLNVLKKFIDSKTSFFGAKVEVVSALSGEEVFVKKMTFPFTSLRKIKKALDFHLSGEEVYGELDRYFVPMYKKKGKETLVTLYGYTKEAMEGHLHDVKTLGVDSEWVSTVTRSLERFAGFFASENESFFLFHLGWESSCFYFFENKEAKREVTFGVGLKNIIDAVQKDLAPLESVDMIAVAELFKQSIDGPNESESKGVFFELEKEISRAWTYMIENSDEVKEAEKILFTGYAEFTRELKEYITPLDLEEVILTPHLEYSAAQISSYAIELGLALDRTMCDKETLQLGEGEFIPHTQKKKAHRYLYRYAGLSLLSASLMFFTIDAYYIKKKGLLKKRYETALSKVSCEKGLPVKFSYKTSSLVKNRKVILQKVKEQKRKNKIDQGPVSFSFLIANVLPFDLESSHIDEISYEVVQRATKNEPLKNYVVDLTCFFEPGATSALVEKVKEDLCACLDGLEFTASVEEVVVEGRTKIVMQVSS